MDFADQISDEARARMLTLLKQRDALELELLDIAKGEAERINGEHREAILTQVHSTRVFIEEYGYEFQYEYYRSLINGYGVVPAIEPARPVGRFEKLLTFLGFEMWKRQH